MSAPMPRARQGILSLTIKDKNALYAAYMQFVKNGGLFIPTTKKYNVGDGRPDHLDHACRRRG